MQSAFPTYEINVFKHNSSASLFGKRGSNNGGGKKKACPVKKRDLPSKTCVVCGRPFAWRKKWERFWDEASCCLKKYNSETRSKS